MGNFFAYLIYKMAQKNYFGGYPVSHCNASFFGKTNLILYSRKNRFWLKQDVYFLFQGLVL